MIKFKKQNGKVILSYTSDYPNPSWVYGEIDHSGSATIEKVFTVTKSELVSKQDTNSEHEPVECEIAQKEGAFYLFPKEILSIDNDLYIHEDIELNKKMFLAERGISIFAKIASITDQDIYIGGNEENSIPEGIFRDLLTAFPNSYELNRYAYARISAILSSYFQTNDDYEEKYLKYMNRKVSRKGTNLDYLVSKAELQKYEDIYEKLTSMLNDEDSYTEAQWQKELLQIVLLLYPKYLHVFKEAPVRDSYNQSNRSIDLLLIDSAGNTDIIEIKKPFDKCIVTERTYRDNYIPLRELSGTVMQIEKYIFYLNKWGKAGEEKLTDHYKNEIAPGFKIKITNPNGIIIMGRTKGMSLDQVQDFEVVRRKYKNVIDIITYDDLLIRLQHLIWRWKAKAEASDLAKGN